MRRAALFGLGLALVGCAHSVGIIDIGQDRVRVRATNGAPIEDVMAEANRGCGLYNRRAIAVSRVCVGEYCSYVDHLFACRDSRPT